MNNKTLLIIFVSLLAIYALSKLGGGKKQRSFDPEIVQIDTANIHRIIFHPLTDDGKAVTLERSGGGKWMISKNQLRVPAQLNPVKGMLSSLSLIKADRIVAKNQERWSEYEVGEEKGNQVRVLDEAGETLADFIVGRFSFNQQTRSGTSYMRLSGNEDVYAVNGFLNMSFGQGFDSYRDNRLLKLNKNDLTAFEIKTETGSYGASKGPGNQWTTTDGTVLDSASMDGYLGQLANVTGSGFADEVDPGLLGAPVRSLSISGNNMVGGPVKVECFAARGQEAPFVLRSSTNEAWFSSDSSGLYQQLFAFPEE